MIRSIELIVAYIYGKKCMLIHLTIVLRVIVSLEYRVSVVPKQRGAPILLREEDKLFFVFVICKTIAGSHRGNQPIVHRKTFETRANI